MSTRRDWREIHEDWRKSGQTITAYCQAGGISVSGFYSGLKRHRLSTLNTKTAPSAKGKSAKFIKAHVTPSTPLQATIELPNGIKISMPHLSFDMLQFFTSLRVR